ncbi:hypothetical protein L1987_55740 [Smallanthus sonchifolius]|uniref:Uncharacterized protein n=1 Tax=Smallanthus sonchifolius TaxID=185202 RepID=A0ACB9EB81_9ASTR|nr:hypothetical protein L1987_55740 [Smallanthus sonchifolius]
MDQNDGGDPNDQFHRNEPISSVVDEGFLGEEDDDDYEDLYNDVNVGEGFLQSLRKNEDLGFNKEEEVEKKLEPVPQPVHHSQAVDDVAGGGGGEGKHENNDGDPSRVEASSNIELGVSEMEGRGSGGLRVELGQSSAKVGEVESGSLNNNNGVPNLDQQQPHHVGTGNMGSLGNAGGDVLATQGGGIVNGSGGSYFGNGGGGGAGGGGGTILFVGDLHWWTTDAELESELCKYGHVKEVKFFDEKASGKSKGYCQVEFYDPSAATACKDGMNGHVFNGRPCVVAFASPYSVKRMGEAQVNRNQQMAPSSAAQAKRGPGDPPAKTGGNNMPAGGNFQGGGDNNRGYGRGNWGRGNGQGMAGRGPGGRGGGRGGMGGRGMMGNGFGPLPMLHPQSMMGQGFDPSFGGPMGRMGNYGCFPGAPTPPFSGMLPSFPPVGNVGLPGLAPHVNPAFFGRGMPMNGMGMMPTGGADGPNMGMWSDPNMPGWAGDDHGGKVGESSYGEEAVSDQQYGEGSHDRGTWSNPAKEKDRDWSGTSDRRVRDDRDREPRYERDLPREKDVVHEDEWPERRHRDERDRERSRDRDHERSRDRERGRDRHRDERDRYADHHRYKEVEQEYDDEWDRGRSSRAHAKSRVAQEDEHRSRSRDADYGKRRRVTAE